MRWNRLLLTLGLIFASVSSAHGQDPQRVNDLIWLGSHNSYRPELDEASLAQLRQLVGARAQGLEYGHPAIATQLDLGVRQLEFDPYADSQGGRFLDPKDPDKTKQALMAKPGAKVLHIPVVDARTHCPTLRACFEQVAKWSDAHQNHQLLVIFVNTKDDQLGDPRLPKVELFDDASLTAIDQDAVDAFGRDRILAPDDVRGLGDNLGMTIQTRGWPSASASRGKILLVLDSNPRIAEVYRQGHKGLKGRMMFGLYDETSPEAGVFNIQNPKTDLERIRTLVAKGFLVRTRSDADTAEARAHDLSRLEAAIKSGAQIISTDYYPGAPDPLGLKFVVQLPVGP